MLNTHVTRGAFAGSFGGVLAGLGLIAIPGPAAAQADGEISHSSDAIRQVVDFNAGPDRVYRALTTEEFDRVVRLSAAARSMALGSTPTHLMPEPGSSFALFGGYVTGRIIELVPASRIVQAWRSASWDPGAYSIARYDIASQGNGARLTFTQTGFPAGEGPTLVKGWHENYWRPLTAYLV